MIRTLFLGTLCLFFIGNSADAQILKAVEKQGKMSFFSETAMEIIDAHSTAANSIINTLTDSIQVKVRITSFEFKNSLMQEHFNENYMESDKFPYAIFRGKMDSRPDYSADGTAKVSASGNLTIHGVTKPVKMEGTLAIQGENTRLQCNFSVKLADYKIDVPPLVMSKISPDIACKADITYNPYKKK